MSDQTTERRSDDCAEVEGDNAIQEHPTGISDTLIHNPITEVSQDEGSTPMSAFLSGATGLVKTTGENSRKRHEETPLGSSGENNTISNTDNRITSTIGDTKGDDFIGSSQESADTSIKAAFELQTKSKSCENSTFLSPKETEKLDELQNEMGKFSYYILGDGRLIVQPENAGEKSQESLKLRIREITAGKWVVTMSNKRFSGEFCTHRIGATMHTGTQRQTVGMYVSYGGAMYCISSAHNFVCHEPNFLSRPWSGKLTDGRLALFDATEKDVKGKNIPVRPVYYVFSTPCTTLNKGRKVMHTVDISVSLAPMLTYLMENGKLQFTRSIQEGQDPCRDCTIPVEECTHSKHSRDADPCRYKISSFYKFVHQCGGQDNAEQHLRCYDEKLLANDEAWIRCRPSGREVLTGKVISFDNRLIFHHSPGNTFQAFNVMLIKPASEVKGPKRGDSGSVWVLKETSEAVAITIGMGILEDGKCVWAAAPLEPLLEELCNVFPEDFTDPSEIKPVCYVDAFSNPPVGAGAPQLATLTASLTPSRSGQPTLDDSAYQTGSSYQTQ